jgi:hypothetical protein
MIFGRQDGKLSLWDVTEQKYGINGQQIAVQIFPQEHQLSDLIPLINLDELSTD